MRGECVGSYRILEELGRGGMGRVWLAETTDEVAGLPSGHRVALKILHPHLLTEAGFFKRFLREAEMGTALEHVNVVRTLDVDMVMRGDDACHFLVMEYVEGQTLRALKDELGRVPEKLCLHVAREIASGLAAIHDAGIVHRDVKPENVLITGDHVVKLMDLGVARLKDQAIRLSRTGFFVGSVLYAAPEQFRSGTEGIDGRADLFALGILLYELAAGEHPFYDEDHHVVLRRVLTENPRPLGERNPQLSPFFEELVHTLLQRDRGARIQTAGEVARILAEGEESRWWGLHSDALRVQTARPLRRIRVPRETAVHGRSEEIRLLTDLFDRAKEGNGQAILIEGEAGIGKTRLLDEFVEQLMRRGEEFDFLFGGYPPGGAATVSGAWSTAYREHFGEERLETTLSMHLGQIPLLIEPFAALLRGGAPPTGVPPLTKETLQTAFVAVTRSLAETRPVIVTIDDLHFAPDGGRGLFVALAHALPGDRVLMIGTTRPGLTDRWPAEMDRLSHAHRMTLDRLGPRHLARILAEAYGSNRLAEELTNRIFIKSDGNPFFVFEIIRGMHETGILRRRDDGSYETTNRIREIDIPSSIRDLVLARISDLSDEDREILEVGSCAGHEFDPSLVARALDLPIVPALRRFGTIEKNTSLIRSVGRTYVFDHHQIQRALHEGLFPQLREQYHAVLAAAIEERGSPADGGMCLSLCEHYLQSDLSEKCLPLLSAALSHLEGGYLHDPAVRLIDLVLDHPALVSGRERVELLLRKASRLDYLGWRDDQEEALDLAHSLAETEGDDALVARILNARGRLLLDVSRDEEAEPVLLEAVERSESAGDPKIRAMALLNLGNAMRSLSRTAEALTVMERSMAIAVEAGDRAAEGQACAGLGVIMNSLGRYEEALALNERGIEIARELRDRHGEAMRVGNQGNVLEHLGRVEEAREHQERCLTMAREIGNRRAEVIATFNLAKMLHDEPPRALVLYERTRDLAEEIRFHSAVAAVAGNLGLLHRARGWMARALDAVDLELERSREIGYGVGEAIATLNRGGALRILGRTQESARLCRLAVEKSREISDRRVEGYALHELAMTLEQAGEADAAETVYRQALALREEIRYLPGVANTHSELGRFLAHEGRTDESEEHLRQAIEMADEQGANDILLPALARAAAGPGGDVERAREAYRRSGERLEHVVRMEVSFLLGRATGDEIPRAEARRLLAELEEHAPPADREALMRNVRLHREIMDERGPDS